MKLSTIPLTDIDTGRRKRSDLGDLEELATSIKERGLITPIAVVEMQYAPPEVVLDSSKPYLLLAGGRRLAATQLAALPTIDAKVFSHTVDELELRCIELAENIKRKDLSWMEKAAMELEIHRLFETKHGKGRRDSNEENWSVSATAEFLGQDRSVVSRTLALAEAVEVYPELFQQCKNKNEAAKLLERVEEKAILSELASRKTSLAGWKQSLIDNYIIKDAFEGMRNLPDGMFHLIEIDPPFNIDYVGGLQQSDASTRIAVHEYSDRVPDYEEYLGLLCREAHRLLATDGWLVVWFAPEPWFESVFNAIRSGGFDVDRLCARWYKATTSGQNNHPDIRLTRVEESFFYARKGNARIIKQGRTSSFDYPRPHHSVRAHPNEKPVELMLDIFSTFLAPRSRILIPFAGSGNGLIAAHKLNMEVLGFDKEQMFKDSFTVKVMEL